MFPLAYPAIFINLKLMTHLFLVSLIFIQLIGWFRLGYFHWSKCSVPSAMKKTGIRLMVVLRSVVSHHQENLLNNQKCENDTSRSHYRIYFMRAERNLKRIKDIMRIWSQVRALTREMSSQKKVGFLGKGHRKHFPVGAKTVCLAYHQEEQKRQQEGQRYQLQQH